MGNAEDGSPNLEPRDILSPISTLLGFLATTLGFIVAAKLDSALFQNLVLVIILVFIAFAATAFLTVGSAYNRNSRLWRWTIRVYMGAWVVLVLGIAAVMAIVAYGPPPKLTLPALNLQVDPFSLTIITVMIISAPLIYTVYYLGVQTNLYSLGRVLVRVSKRLGVSLPDRYKQLQGIPDPKPVFIDRYGELERSLKNTSPSTFLDPDLYQLWRQVTDVRDGIIHGLYFPSKQLKDALIGADVLTDALTSEIKEREHDGSEPPNECLKLARETKRLAAEIQLLSREITSLFESSRGASGTYQIKAGSKEFQEIQVKDEQLQRAKQEFDEKTLQFRKQCLGLP